VDNTIYVLNQKELTLIGPIQMGECTAIVSPVETQLFPNTKVFLYKYMISQVDEEYAVVDNI
jgi:hypothetical protein